MDRAARRRAWSAMEQQVQVLVAGIREAGQLTARDIDASVLTQHMQQLLELCQEESVLQLVVLEGGVEAVVPMLTLADSVHSSLMDVAKYACCTLSLMALQQPELKPLIVASHALPGLLHLLSPRVDAVVPDVSRCAVEAITELAMDDSSMQELLCESGAVDSTIKLLVSRDVRTQHAAVVALSTLTTGNDAAKHLVASCEGVLQQLVKLLRSTDSNVQQASLQLLCDLVHSGKDVRHAALQAGALVPLVRLLLVRDGDTQHSAALLVGQLAAPPLEEDTLTGGRGSTFFSVEQDVIPALVPLLSAPRMAVQEMAAFALARLAQLPTYQAAILQHRALPPLLQLLNSPSSKVQYNAAFVLYELSDSREVAAHMQQVRGVQHLLAASQKMQEGGQLKVCVERTITRLQQQQPQHRGSLDVLGRVQVLQHDQQRQQHHTHQQHRCQAGTALLPPPLQKNTTTTTTQARRPQQQQASAAAAAEGGVTLMPSSLRAQRGFGSFDINDHAAGQGGSPLARTIFGGQQVNAAVFSTGINNSHLEHDLLPAAAPLRLPSIDSIVGEAATAEAASVMAAMSHSHTSFSHLDQVTPLPPAATTQLELAAVPAAAAAAAALVQLGPTVGELQQLAGAVELCVQQLDHVQHSLNSPLLQLCVLNLLRAATGPLQQQQQAAVQLIQQHELHYHAAAAASPSAAAGLVISPAVDTLSVAAAAHAQVVASLLDALQLELSQQLEAAASEPPSAAASLWQLLSSCGLMLQAYFSVYRWGSTTEQLLLEVVLPARYGLSPSSCSSSRFSSATVLVAAALAVLYLHSMRYPGLLLSLLCGALTLLLAQHFSSAASKPGVVDQHQHLHQHLLQLQQAGGDWQRAAEAAVLDDGADATATVKAAVGGAGRGFGGVSDKAFSFAHGGKQGSGAPAAAAAPSLGAPHHQPSVAGADSFVFGCVTAVAVVVAVAATAFSMGSSAAVAGPSASRTYSSSSSSLADGYTSGAGLQGWVRAVFGIAVVVTVVSCLLQLLERVSEQQVQHVVQVLTGIEPGTPAPQPDEQQEAAVGAPSEALDPQQPKQQQEELQDAVKCTDQQQQAQQQEEQEQEEEVKPPQPSVQSIVAAAERAEELGLTTTRSKLTVSALRAHTKRQHQQHKSDDPDEFGRSPALTTRSQEDAAYAHRDLNSLQRRSMPWSPQVSVQGRFAHPPIDTGAVTSWEAVEQRVRWGSSGAKTTSSSKTSTPKGDKSPRSQARPSSAKPAPTTKAATSGKGKIGAAAAAARAWVKGDADAARPPTPSRQPPKERAVSFSTGTASSQDSSPADTPTVRPHARSALAGARDGAGSRGSAAVASRHHHHQQQPQAVVCARRRG